MEKYTKIDNEKVSKTETKVIEISVTEIMRQIKFKTERVTALDNEIAELKSQLKDIKKDTGVEAVSVN